jgi:hypothetical protein
MALSTTDRGHFESALRLVQLDAKRQRARATQLRVEAQPYLQHKLPLLEQADQAELRAGDSEVLAAKLQAFLQREGV